MNGNQPESDFELVRTEGGGLVAVQLVHHNLLHAEKNLPNSFCRDENPDTDDSIIQCPGF